ncbi:MAG: insulinase family protein [Pseudomonadota bacterium]|nr:insulinase family protein [Pseudomonadota bacterium]
MISFIEEKSTNIKNLGVVLREFRHDVTSARHLHLEAKDDNNAFMVGFPTIPHNSTGVAHILEHTVLCGSRRFPVRDPFFMMLRRSLNTYMNAFTAPDMTAYPFATKNKKDFYNLLDVYLDATFFPILDELDFFQEGWRYEVGKKNSEQKFLYQGVVFNEMKGAMSSPNSQLWQHLHSALFPETSYRFNSGGDPVKIPDLTYDELKQFHKQFYNPSNAVFLTYGDLPVEEHQKKFEDAVLKNFKSATKLNKIEKQRPFEVATQLNHRYFQSKIESGSDFVLWAWVYGSTTDPLDVIEMSLVAEILLGHSGSPLQSYLESANDAKAPSELGGIDDSTRQLIFICGLEGVTAVNEGVETHETKLFEILESLIKKPPSLDILTASLDRLELEQSDLGAGNYPLGLQLFGRILPSAVYRDDPVHLLKLEEVITNLRKQLKRKNYFPDLLKKIFINNLHTTRIIMRPSDEIDPEMLINEKLKSLIANFSDEKKTEIRLNSNLLENRQNTTCDANILPKLTLNDVPNGNPLMSPSDFSSNNITAFDVPTNNVFRLNLAFPIANLTMEELNLLPIWCEMVTQFGSGQDDYATVQQKRAAIGEFDVNCHFSSNFSKENFLTGFVTVSAKGLNRKIDELVSASTNLISTVRFNENERFADLIKQISNEYEQSMVQRGHILAMLSSSRHLNEACNLEEAWNGCSFIKRVKNIAGENFKPEQAEKLFSQFNLIRNKILKLEPRILLVTDKEHLKKSVHAMEKYYSSPIASESIINVDENKFDQPYSWLIESNINYCALSFRSVNENNPEAARYSVLGKYLQDEYLHSKIREKGGAYGSGANYFSSSETFKFFSYRDPRISGTLDDFSSSIKTFIKSGPNQSRLEESILGVIRSLDGSRRPVAEASRSFNCILNGKTDEKLEEFRNNVLSTDFTSLLRTAESLLEQKPSVAVVSNSANIKELEKNKLAFERV